MPRPLPLCSRLSAPARVVGSVVALTATTVACGSSGDPGPVVGTARIEAFEMGFDPAEIVVPAGRVEITVENTGRVPHTFVIQGRGFKLRAFDTGQTASGIVDLPTGAYFVYCDITGHRDAGMAGSIFVGDVERPSTTTSTSAPG